MYNEYVDQLIKIEEMDSYRQLKWLKNVKNYEQTKIDNKRVLEYFKNAEYKIENSINILNIAFQIKYMIITNDYIGFLNLATSFCLDDIAKDGIISSKSLDIVDMVFDGLQDLLLNQSSIYSKEQKEFRNHVKNLDNVSGNEKIALWLVAFNNMKAEERIKRIASRKLLSKTDYNGEDTFKYSIRAYYLKSEEKYEEALDLYVKSMISEFVNNEEICDSEYEELEKCLNDYIYKKNPKIK